jgi:glycosyltransferase involved in cell wall biosynthesis
MRVLFFWEAAGLSLDRANPYGGLLARALADVGVELVAGHAEPFTAEWVRANQGEVDVLHLNWPNFLYDAPDLAGQVARCADLVSNLTLARTLGYKIVWTVHNLYPHETLSHSLDRLLHLALTNLCSAVIVHCEHARQLVHQHFHRDENVFVIPHGHFIDAYPNTLDRQAARQQLGIDEESFVYLFFGNVRPYKGLETLLEVFGRLPGADLRLLLAAKVYNDYGDHFVEEARRADPRILVHPSRFFANEEFQRFFNAADVAVLPFLDVLTSGSTITALSFGIPVIVPGVGCLPELVHEPAGIVYDQQQPDALYAAMLAMQQRDLAAARQAAYQRAQSLGWDDIARATLAAYRS